MTFLIDASILLLFATLVIAAGLTLYALWCGQTLVDRLVAVDLLGMLMISACGLAALRSGSTTFLDVAFGLSLIGFLTTVFFALFLEKAPETQAISTSLDSKSLLDPELL
jgi:multicomponent Na+:H+ antiporter subunit F